MLSHAKPKIELPTQIKIPTAPHTLLKQVLDLVNANEEILTLWKITNVTALNRLELTDHGILHFNIVANNALKIARILQKQKVRFSICKDYGLSIDHAEVVILLTSLLHDLGMSIHRQSHEEFSLFLANTLLREILSFLPIPERTILISEVLHAIISHRSDGRPLTIEAGIVRVADALDMSEGRSRLPYKESHLDIHSVSAMSIDTVEIRENNKGRVQIDIVMNHTAGIFQIDELLKKKVIGSGIEKYLAFKIYMDKGKGKKLFKSFP